MTTTVVRCAHGLCFGAAPQAFELSAAQPRGAQSWPEQKKTRASIKIQIACKKQPAPCEAPRGAWLSQGFVLPFEPYAEASLQLWAVRVYGLVAPSFWRGRRARPLSLGLADTTRLVHRTRTRRRAQHQWAYRRAVPQALFGAWPQSLTSAHQATRFQTPGVMKRPWPKRPLPTMKRPSRP